MTTVQRAKELIRKIEYATLATVTVDGCPWNSPVYVAYDDHYNFYWGTDRNSQKSRNIHHNSNVFLVIYDSTSPAGEGEGVYIEATAEELQDFEEIEFAHTLLSDRSKARYWKLEQLQGATPVRLYRAIPKKIWMNGEDVKDGCSVDVRVELKLV